MKKREREINRERHNKGDSVGNFLSNLTESK